MPKRLNGHYRLVLTALLTALLLASAGCGGALPLPLEADATLSDDSARSGELDSDNTLAIAADNCLGDSVPTSITKQAMLDALNEYRAENGLSPLIYSTMLEKTIDAHCEDMWIRDYFDHVNPEGLRPADRALAMGFCHRYVGENIAAGQPTLERVMQAWKDSPPHDENMKVADYVYVGMGVYTAPNGRTYWGQLMAYHYEE